MADPTATVYSGRRLCVVAPGRVAAAGKVSVTIAVGAFGSGEHETTASCLEVLEGLGDLDGADVLDLGSGTGILAIAAVRLGARAATCVDIEASAVETARRNAELNGVEERVAHVHGELTAVPRDGFDVVLANVYADVLCAVSGDLVAKVRHGGTLVLSGIPLEVDWEIRQLYGALGCEVLRHRTLEEFSTVVLRRR